MTKSFLRNSYIQRRDGEDGVLFNAFVDPIRGPVVEAALDRYAVIPIEDYIALVTAVRGGGETTELQTLLSPKSGPISPPALSS